MINYNTIMEIMLQGALSTVRRHMMIAPTTQYRTSLLSQMGAVMLEIDRIRGVSPALSVRTRALLLMPKRALGSDVNAEGVSAYVRAVALDEPASRLAELVQWTDSVELMKRFLRTVPGVQCEEIQGMLCLAEVTLS